MRRNINPDYEFEKGKFADTLKRAMEGRSYSAFAREADISFPYISKYMNLKCDSAPTIATIKKLASATKLVSYEELLEAAGYDPTKYTLSDDIVVPIGNGATTFTSYFNSVFTSVTRADFKWNFSNHGANGRDPFTLKIEGAPFESWYFVPVNKVDVSKADIMEVLSGTDDFTIEQNSKISFMTASKNTYEALKSMDFGIISLYISAIFVNPEKGNIEEETYLNTATKITKEDEMKYAITYEKEDIGASFYSI